MGKITINENICKGCSLCVQSCPKKLIAISETKINDKGYFVAEFNKDEKACVGCAMCAVMCPDCAIVVEK